MARRKILQQADGTRHLALSPEVLAVLADLDVSARTRSVVIREQIDRKLYVEVNRVLELLGGTWNRAAKAHLFSDDPTDRIDAVVVNGSVLDPKINDFFETPVELAHRMAALLDPQPGEPYLEPSAGRGALIRAVLDRCPTARVHAHELLREHYEHLLRTFDPHRLVACTRGDFLAPPDFPGNFAGVIMNPPFSRRQDALHIRAAFRQLRPGGRLVSVASGGLAFRRDALHREVREQIEAWGGSIEPLPAESFKASGTSVNTVLVVATRPGGGV